MLDDAYPTGEVLMRVLNASRHVALVEIHLLLRFLSCEDRNTPECADRP